MRNSVGKHFEVKYVCMCKGILCFVIFWNMIRNLENIVNLYF